MRVFSTTICFYISIGGSNVAWLTWSFSYDYLVNGLVSSWNSILSVPSQDRFWFSDPITQFLESLYFDIDFDAAQENMDICDSVLSLFSLREVTVWLQPIERFGLIRCCFRRCVFVKDVFDSKMNYECDLCMSQRTKIFGVHSSTLFSIRSDWHADLVKMEWDCTASTSALALSVGK